MYSYRSLQTPRLCRLNSSTLKAASRNSKSVSRLSYVRRRCTTLDNRGCRQSRNPRTGIRPYALLSDTDLSPRFLRRNGTSLRALFVDKSPEIRFLRKHATHSITPQARKQSFACHFAALVFMDYTRVPTTSSPAVIQCSAPPAHTF